MISARRARISGLGAGRAITAASFTGAEDAHLGAEGQG
jgi:hypothetical protein